MDYGGLDSRVVTIEAFVYGQNFRGLNISPHKILIETKVN